MFMILIEFTIYVSVHVFYPLYSRANTPDASTVLEPMSSEWVGGGDDDMMLI